PPRRSRRRTRSRPRPPGAAARPAGRPWPPSRLSAMVAGHVTLLTPMAHTGHVLAQHHTPSGEMAPRSRSAGMCRTSPDGPADVVAPGPLVFVEPGGPPEPGRHTVSARLRNGLLSHSVRMTITEYLHRAVLDVPP